MTGYFCNAMREFGINRRLQQLMSRMFLLFQFPLKVFYIVSLIFIINIMLFIFVLSVLDDDYFVYAKFVWLIFVILLWIWKSVSRAKCVNDDVINSWLFPQDNGNYNCLRNSSCEAYGGSRGSRFNRTFSALNLSYVFSFVFPYFFFLKHHSSTCKILFLHGLDFWPIVQGAKRLYMEL